MSFPIILLIIVLVFGFYVVSKYNSIIALRNNREKSFADIDVQLKLRFDLIPNLINTVKWYAEHEKSTFNDVVEARNKYMSAGNSDEKIGASNMLTAALWKIFALAEAYPELKANEGFVKLQMELSDIENKLAASRRFFNATTTEYNTYIEMFPASIIAWIFNFKRAVLFEIWNREEFEKTPNVQF